MKWLLFLVLGILTGCTTIQFDEDDMSKAQYGSSGGWSGTGILFNDGQSNKGMAANFLERSNNEIPSKNYTVQFAISKIKTLDNFDTAVYFINPVGVITWSVAGNSVRREVSVTNGLSLTGVGEGVKVVVYDRTPAGQIPVSYQVDITVAPGSRASENQPPTYCPTLALTEGMIIVGNQTLQNQVVLNIPVNAGCISVYVTAIRADLTTPLTTLQARVDQVDANDVIVRTYDPNSNFPTTFVPLMPTAVKLILNNTMGGSDPGNDIAFAVTYGIDG